MNEDFYNPWHGCHKYSEGCLNCYVYRRDDQIGKDASVVTKTSSFYLLKSKKRSGEYKIASGRTIYVCMTSDFFIEEADPWRDEIWEMIFLRKDLHFIIFTKRIHRFYQCIPDNWTDGYEHVTIICTMESQNQVDKRLPFFLSLPIRHKKIACEPLLTDIDFHQPLTGIEGITVGGESGEKARPCHYEWIVHIRAQAIENGVSFFFHQTGANFIKNGRQYHIERAQQHSQARRAHIDT